MLCMKRTYSKAGRHTESTMYEDGAPLEHAPAQSHLTPPFSPEHDLHPSKIRRHGSKLISALRSLTNSGKCLTCMLVNNSTCWLSYLTSVSNASNAEQVIPSPVVSLGLGQKVSAAFVRGKLEPNVVHRAQFKSRPSLISLDKEVWEISPEGSGPATPDSSRNSGKSGLSSPATPGESTGKTSLDSKFLAKSSKLDSQQSSENKKVIHKQETVDVELTESFLEPIAEIDPSDNEPIPSKLPWITLWNLWSDK